MTTLIVRPAAEAEALVALLKANNMPALAQPLMQQVPNNAVSQLPHCLASLSKGDFLIAISTAAIEMAHNYLKENGLFWSSEVSYLAVGMKTAQKWQTFVDQPVLYPPHRADSEGVLNLPCLQDIQHRRIVILRGNGGREHLYQALEARGATVQYCETYQRQWLTLSGHTLIQTWQAQNVTRIVITSGEQIERLCQLVPINARSWLWTRSLFVPSQRLNDLAVTLGFTDIHTVGSANNLAIVTVLINMG